MSNKKEDSSLLSRRSFVANTGVVVAGSVAALGAGLAATPARAAADRDYSTLLVEQRDNGLLIVTLNRPDAGNAVNTQMGIELLVSCMKRWPLANIVEYGKSMKHSNHVRP